jgi:hypothetical protein
MNDLLKEDMELIRKLKHHPRQVSAKDMMDKGNLSEFELDRLMNGE